jgi:hypothetical protein
MKYWFLYGLLRIVDMVCIDQDVIQFHGVNEAVALHLKIIVIVWKFPMFCCVGVGAIPQK